MIDRVKKYIEENGLSKKHRNYSRKDEDKWRRYYLMKYLKVTYSMTQSDTGALFGLDHATVLNGLRQYEILSNYQDFNNIVKSLQILFPLTESCGHEPENLTISLLTLENGRIY